MSGRSDSQAVRAQTLNSVAEASGTFFQEQCHVDGWRTALAWPKKHWYKYSWRALNGSLPSEAWEADRQRMQQEISRCSDNGQLKGFFICLCYFTIKSKPGTSFIGKSMLQTHQTINSATKLKRAAVKCTRCPFSPKQNLNYLNIFFFHS